LKKRSSHCKNVSELEAALKEEWIQIPFGKLNKLIESVPRRVEHVFLTVAGQQDTEFLFNK